MHFQLIIGFVKDLFRRVRLQSVHCPLYTRVWLGYLLVVGALLFARVAVSTVIPVGDVTPQDNPFTSFNEGLPKNGNAPDFSATPSPPEENQTTWEGIQNAIANTNINTNIRVGIIGTGILQINSVELRDMHLIIGDSGTLPGTSNVTRYGDGTVYITGSGSLYNNDPYIVPSYLPSNFKSKVPRLSDSQAGAGFDLYVGKKGTGTLKIDAFGRAEIEDAVLIGDAATAVGNVIVDGFNSTLTSGGSFDFGASAEPGTTGNPGDSLHMMIIGRQGIGTMTVSNAATVDTKVFTAATGNSDGGVAAALGSTPYSLTNGNAPDAGGAGTATVTGPGSKWLLSGSLQVGGFDIGEADQTTGAPEVEGDNVLYNSQSGRGNLYVNDGGMVNIQNAIGVDNSTTNQPALLLAIGRFGVVQLSAGTSGTGGTINIGSPVTSGTPGGQNQPKPDSVGVVNDGVIKGTGYINTGTFHNRYYGQVRVETGQSLTINSASAGVVIPNQTFIPPLVNYGLIEVLGTADSRSSLEFVRAPGDLNPLINRILFPPNPPTSQDQFSGGIISAQWATLRSQSGIQNEGVIAFTAGSNIIQGSVKQITGSTGFTPRFEIGPNTQVVAESDFSHVVTFFGTGNSLRVLDPGTYTSAGVMTLPMSYSNPNLIAVSGDMGISGTIKVSFEPDLLADLSSHGPGRSYEIISFGGQAYQTKQLTDGSWAPDYSKVIPNCSGSTYCTVPGLGVDDGNLNLGSLLGPSFNNVVPIAQRIGQRIMITFFNPGGGGAVAPDFNGDGVVNGADLAIWQANVGIPSGATVLQGDADGDGDVDGADFLKWQRNAGRAPPWTGAGSGGPNIPEPTSVALMLCGALALIGTRRHRTRR
jgi:T5SS/PEP-CTERM-associated repeat protein